MNGKTELTKREEKLIEELTVMIAKVDSQNVVLKEPIFRGLASYVEGIKTGLNFQKCAKDFHSV